MPTTWLGSPSYLKRLYFYPILRRIQNQSMLQLKINPYVQHHKKGTSDKFSFAKINKLVVHSTDCTRIIPTDKIEFMEASGGYCRLHFLDGSTLLVSKTLKHISSSLGSSFLRIHNSYVINLTYMKEYRSKDGQITMESEKIVQVSRVNKHKLRAILQSL